MFTLIIHAVVSLFAVMNPIGNVPIFISLTEEETLANKRKIARKSLLISLLILVIFLLFGHFIFEAFGITIDAFRIVGGILIFGIAYNLLQAKQSRLHSLHPDEHEESVAKEDISVTPLATPIFAGPGTIATVMALAGGADQVKHSIAVLIAILIVLVGTYIILYFSGSILHYLGKTGMNVITRLMGLLLAVIAVQMMIEGLSAVFAGWS